MKRILLITSLLSFAAQVPVHAESKIVKWFNHEANQKAMMHAGKAIVTDAKALGKITVAAVSKAYSVLPAVPSADQVLKVGDALVKAPFKAYAQYPALMTAVSMGATLGTSLYLWNQSKKASENREHQKARNYEGAAIMVGLCGIVASAIAGLELSMPSRHVQL